MEREWHAKPVGVFSGLVLLFNGEKISLQKQNNSKLAKDSSITPDFQQPEFFSEILPTQVPKMNGFRFEISEEPRSIKVSWDEDISYNIRNLDESSL